MVNQSNCQCTMTRFDVSRIYASTEKEGEYFFTVDAICVDCGERQIIAMHNKERLASLVLFREHHEMTVDFYKGLE